MTHITVVSRALITVVPAPSGAGTHLVVCVNTPDAIPAPEGTGMTVGHCLDFQVVTVNGILTTRFIIARTPPRAYQLDKLA